MIITYKSCDIGDLQTLINIAKTTFVAAFERYNKPDDFKTYIASAFSEKQLKSELDNPHSNFYFAYLNDNLVGYFKLNEKDAQNETFGRTSIELERIYVLEGFQNKAIGHKLLVKAIALSKSKRVDFLWLGVWEKNEAALRFYERYGFKKFDKHPYYIGTDKQMDWLLKLELT